MPKNYCIMQIWAESGKSALPICNYSQILYQFLTFTQNLKRSPELDTQKTAVITAAVFLSPSFPANIPDNDPSDRFRSEERIHGSP